MVVVPVGDPEVSAESRTPSDPMKDPHDLRAALTRFDELRGKTVTGISADVHGVVLVFEDGYRLGPLSRYTGISIRKLVREER